MTGAIGDSYLFAQNPASLGQIVKKTQAAYRNQLAKNVVSINSHAAVYYHTREYLSLCLPPTIEAQVQDLVAKAKAGSANIPGTRTSASGQPGNAAATVITLTPGT
jgi:hypothetical protein